MVRNELGSLEAGLRSKESLDRESAAMELVAIGRDGLRVLAKVAIDVSAPAVARVTALRHLPADEEGIGASRVLLRDVLPVLRALALEKVKLAHAIALRPVVEELTHDPATFWDLDEKIAVAQLAMRVLESLS